MIRSYLSGCLVWMILFFTGCRSQEKETTADSPYYGTIEISVDESFQPVIDEQIRAYEATYPGTKIIAHYKPEAECLRDLRKDSSNRLVIITRGLTDREERLFRDSMGYTPGWNRVATDAIAILVNIKSNDTLYTRSQLTNLLTGKSMIKKDIVFDGLTATSTLRYINDSMLRGAAFDTSVVKAAKNSREVINYIAGDENAIGFVGISWIGNPEISWQTDMLKKVKIAYVQCHYCDSVPYVKPMQESIMSRRYPLVRGLYYVVKENYQGLGTGFISFLKSERGQLIFRRAYLAPIMELGIRNVKINETLPQ